MIILKELQCIYFEEVLHWILFNQRTKMNVILIGWPPIMQAANILVLSSTQLNQQTLHCAQPVGPHSSRHLNYKNPGTYAPTGHSQASFKRGIPGHAEGLSLLYSKILSRTNTLNNFSELCPNQLSWKAPVQMPQMTRITIRINWRFKSNYDNYRI